MTGDLRNGDGPHHWTPENEHCWSTECECPSRPRSGEALRDEGTAQVISHTPSSYRAEFARVVQGFRAERIEFTSEDVTRRIGQPPNHPNAVGALTRAIAIEYGAVKVGHTKARRANQHATEISLWGWPKDTMCPQHGVQSWRCATWLHVEEP